MKYQFRGGHEIGYSNRSLTRNIVALPQGERGILFLIIPEGGNKHPKGDGAHPEGGEAPRGMGAVSRGVFIAS